ncbi:MAG TPA: hypothetical protein VG028_02890 [Terriglobia bacterium]|nr:hypothetical protein [Terriglobia bacterium]
MKINIAQLRLIYLERWLHKKYHYYREKANRYGKHHAIKEYFHALEPSEVTYQDS